MFIFLTNNNILKDFSHTFLTMIIVICGTVGAGKGAVTKHLMVKGFKHYSARKYLSGILKERGLKPDRNNLINLANELRKRSPVHITEKLLEMAQKQGGDCVIESARTINEIKPIKDMEDSCLLAIDADREIRYERIKERGAETDNISFEEFVRDDKREWKNPDPDKINIGACIEIADFKLVNNGTLHELHKKIDEILEKIKSKTF